MPQRPLGGIIRRLDTFLPIDVLLEGLQPLLVVLNEGQDGRLGSKRYLVPEFMRDRRKRRHINILRSLKGRTSSWRERLPPK
jgi:hypothetical protein